MDAILQYLNSNQGAIIAISTVLIAVMAILTGVFTLVLIRENILIRKAGTEPMVVAYFATDSHHKTIVNIVLSNIGQGAARNVRFRFDADEGDFLTHKVQISNDRERTAVGTLPQGEKIEAFFGSGPELMRDPRLKPFNVIIEYENINGTPQSNSSLLDIAQYNGLMFIGQSPEHEIADSIKRINQTLHDVTIGSKRIKVETKSAS